VRALAPPSRVQGPSLRRQLTRAPRPARRSLLSWVGLGSTSEYAAKHLAMPLLIVRPKPPDPAAAAQAAATAARAAERIAAAAEAKAAKDAAAMRAAGGP